MTLYDCAYYYCQYLTKMANFFFSIYNYVSKSLTNVLVNMHFFDKYKMFSYKCENTRSQHLSYTQTVNVCLFCKQQQQIKKQFINQYAIP